MASFPATIKTFTTKENVVHVVDADHPNTSEAEITAIETVLGANPHISIARAATYLSVAERLEDIETDYRLLTNHDTHALLGGLGGDDHAQYLRTDGTRALTGMTAIAAAPGAVAAGDTVAEGVALSLARSDHRHSVATAAPAASAVGDAQAAGTATSFARSDHKHAREAFGPVSDGTAYGGAPANGTAPTVARSDHFHGTPALQTGGTPVTQDYGDAAAAGAAATAARADHRHGMPALASTAPVTQVLGDAAAVGIATTPARADHRHGMPALATTVTDERTWGIAPAIGTSPVPARQDHTHGSPDPTLMGPSGVVAIWPTNIPPVGWLICDGSTPLIADHPVLAGILGTTYGGNGTTTFGLPNLKGRVVVGRDAADADWDTLGETRGSKTHTLTLAQAPSHAHTVNSHSHGGGTGWKNHNVSHGHSISYEYVTSSFMAANWEHDHHYDQPNVNNIGLSPGSNQYALNRLGNRTGKTNTDHQHSANHGHSAGSTDTNHTHNVSAEAPGTNAQGGGSAFNIIQPSMVFNYIIKA